MAFMRKRGQAITVDGCCIGFICDGEIQVSHLWSRETLTYVDGGTKFTLTKQLSFPKTIYVKVNILHTGSRPQETRQIRLACCQDNSVTLTSLELEPATILLKPQKASVGEIADFATIITPNPYPANIFDENYTLVREILMQHFGFSRVREIDLMHSNFAICTTAGIVGFQLNGQVYIDSFYFYDMFQLNDNTFVSERTILEIEEWVPFSELGIEDDQGVDSRPIITNNTALALIDCEKKRVGFPHLYLEKLKQFGQFWGEEVSTRTRNFYTYLRADLLLKRHDPSKVFKQFPERPSLHSTTGQEFVDFKVTQEIFFHPIKKYIQEMKLDTEEHFPRKISHFNTFVRFGKKIGAFLEETPELDESRLYQFDFQVSTYYNKALNLTPIRTKHVVYIGDIESLYIVLSKCKFGPDVARKIVEFAYDCCSKDLTKIGDTSFTPPSAISSLRSFLKHTR
jgi:hypothetical protein